MDLLSHLEFDLEKRTTRTEWVLQCHPASSCPQSYSVLLQFWELHQDTIFSSPHLNF